MTPLMEILAAEIRLCGHVPAKKNKWRIRANGTVGITDSDAIAEINGLKLQAQSQWRRPALTKARVHMVFSITSLRGDLDGKETTILDVLVAAGVLWDDSMAHLCKKSAEWVRGKEEGVEIWITGTVAHKKKQRKGAA